MKSVVLLSSGIDSTVNAFEAKLNSTVVLALTFNYGQKSAASEIRQAKKIAEELSVQHLVVDLSFFKGWGTSSLTNAEKAIPQNTEVRIDDPTQSQKTAKSVWVPNRNGVFLNIAAGFAESLNADAVVPGFNIEEAATFPDNSKDFMVATENALAYSTLNKVRIKCFTVDMDKTQIVKHGQELGVNWSHTWPCYQSLEVWCGQCESCLRAKRAFVANQIAWLGN